MDSVVFANTVVTENKSLVDIRVSVGSLDPILPRFTDRYDVANKVKRSHATVEAGMYMTSRTPLPQYLPQQWSAYVHPEGKVYFCRNAQLRVVTDSYLYDRVAADKIMTWISHIEKLASEKSFNLTENVELYVRLEGDNCIYYFVDHSVRALFWLDTYDTRELGLAPVVSNSHLKLQLEEQYWLHLEYFPMHPIQFYSNIIEELISTLTSGAGDHITSRDSTFPYGQKECRRLLGLLVPCRDQVNNGQIISLVARLNSVIVANRWNTHYGQEQARLSRSTGILEEEESEISWTQPISSAITLGVSDHFNSRFSEIFPDNYIYEIDWKKFMSESLKKWKTSFFMSLGLLTLHLFCFYLPLSQTLALVSGGCLSLSILSAGLLIWNWESREDSTADDALLCLMRARLPKVGFQGVALLFSLPQAFNLWGLFLLFGQAFTVVDSLYLACIAASFAIVLGLIKLSRPLRRLLFSMASKKSEEPSSLV